jgi:hypothetical protein
MDSTMGTFNGEVQMRTNQHVDGVWTAPIEKNWDVQLIQLAWQIDDISTKCCSIARYDILVKCTAVTVRKEIIG